MTEKQRGMIRDYLPHGRDPELGDDEYYVEDLSGRIVKVRIVDINPSKGMGTVYGVVMANSARRVNPGYDNGFAMSELYDNKQDCKDMTHAGFNHWEELRQLEEIG